VAGFVLVFQVRLTVYDSIFYVETRLSVYITDYVTMDGISKGQALETK